jgi:hypothetical protein
MKLNNIEDKEMIRHALAAGDDWLRKQGIISDFSINTIIVSTYINFPQVRNVEIDIDRTEQKLYMRVYCSIWSILLMILLGKRDKFIDSLFDWLQEYLPTYQLSVELRRWRGKKGANHDTPVNVSNKSDFHSESDYTELSGVFTQASATGNHNTINPVEAPTKAQSELESGDGKGDTQRNE